MVKNRVNTESPEKVHMTSAICWQTLAIPRASNAPRGPAAASEASFHSVFSHPQDTFIYCCCGFCFSLTKEASFITQIKYTADSVSSQSIDYSAF